MAVDHLCYFCLVFVMLSCTSVYWCLVVTCWKRLTSWLSFVMSNCEVVTFSLVLWVCCRAWLYWFLIFALFLAFTKVQFWVELLTLKVPCTTASDNKFCDIFPNLQKNKVWHFMRIVCQQTILMKYHAFFVSFKKAAKFEIVICCKL